MSELNNERNVDQLAGWIMKLSLLAIMALLCWYFRSVLVYVLVAFVVSTQRRRMWYRPLWYLWSDSR